MNLLLVLIPAIAVQFQAPVVDSCEPDPTDGSRCTLTYEDGWWVGFASVEPLDSVAIRGSATPPAPDLSDLDEWFETTAGDLFVEGGVPAPGLPDSHQGEAPGLAHAVVIAGLHPNTTYFIAIRGTAMDWGLPIPLMNPEGWAVVTTGGPAAPFPAGTPVPAATASSGGGRGGCGASSAGAANLSWLAMMLGILRHRMIRSGLPSGEKTCSR